MPARNQRSPRSKRPTVLAGSQCHRDVELLVRDRHVLCCGLPQTRILQHDLAQPLPLPDRSVDIVISHNTLECLLDPAAL